MKQVQGVRGRVSLTEKKERYNGGKTVYILEKSGGSHAGKDNYIRKERGNLKGSFTFGDSVIPGYYFKGN